MYFKSKKAQIAIIEVGLGGRDDATNIINPILSIITNISIEHSKILGNTVEEIAKIKGGIIKNNIPSIFGPNTPSVLEEMAKVKLKVM